MRVAELPPPVLAGRLDAGELLLATGPFVARLRSPLPGLARSIGRAYRDFELAPQHAFADFQIELLARRGPGHWLRPALRARVDGRPATTPPASTDLAPALLERLLDEQVAALAHQYLLLRTAVVERGGCALLLAAPPGAGTSTLTAGLVHQGWRLLSDTLALVDPASGLVQGMARPIRLRGRGIDAVRRFAPGLDLDETVGEQGQRLALVRPPADSVARMREPAWPGWLVLPRFRPGSPTRLAPQDTASAFLALARHSPNHALHGLRGFRAMGELFDQCSVHRMRWGHLGDAVQALDQLTREPPCPSARRC